MPIVENVQFQESIHLQFVCFKRFMNAVPKTTILKFIEELDGHKFQQDLSCFLSRKRERMVWSKC